MVLNGNQKGRIDLLSVITCWTNRCRV